MINYCNWVWETTTEEVVDDVDDDDGFYTFSRKIFAHQDVSRTEPFIFISMTKKNSNIQIKKVRDQTISDKWFSKSW